MRWLSLILPASCTFPNPTSDAHDWCERIRDAEAAYFTRCAIAPSAAELDCSRIWDVDASDEELGDCLAELEGATCGSLPDWPAVCPKHWTKVPWET